jgi:hypothetical protein
MADYYVFASDYRTGMDRYYEPIAVGPTEMPINKLGISTPPMKEQLESLKARIFQGASKVELGFMGEINTCNSLDVAHRMRRRFRVN